MPNDLAPSPIRDPRVKAVLARPHTGRKRHASGGPLGDLNASRDPFQYAEYGFSIVPEQGDLIYLLCRGLRTQRWKDYFSRRFCECLDRLALIYGFATKRK